MQTKEQHRKNNLQYYHKKRKVLIQQLGGRCAMCGSTENLEFDHIDKNEKSFGIGECLQYGSSHLQPELIKCQLLCRDCHIRKSKEFKDNNTKINKDIANSICEEYATTNLTQDELGEKYGISARTVSSIVNGERWSNETMVTRQSSTFDKQYNRTTSSSTFPKVSVDMIDPVTKEVIHTYESMADAARDGHASSHISDCCNGKKKTHHGFIWKKHEE